MKRKALHWLFYPVSVIFFITILTWGITALTISAKYDLSFTTAAKQCTRFVLLTGIEYATKIYDPTPVQDVAFQPATPENLNWKDYVRIEDLLNNNKLGDKLSVTKIKNEKIIKSRFEFSYQPYGEQRLAKLRKEYKLDNLVASAKDEFEAMILLRNWARSQFRRNDYQPFVKPFDALTILKRNHRNKDRVPHQPDQYRPCHFFPLFYSQVMLSMGYQIRVIQISHDSYKGHGMTEVWSNQYEKWFTMDADSNHYYEKDGIPQNILEVHNQRYMPKPYNLKKIRGIQTSGDGEHLKKTSSIDETVSYHSYIRIVDLRNDWITNQYFPGHPKRSDRASLFWVDKNLPPVFNLFQQTDDINDFYWTLNQAEIWAKNEFNQETMILSLAIKTFTPNFDHFEIVIDESIKEAVSKPDFAWKLHPGVNTLSVYPVNKYGIQGIYSFIEIQVK